jgi:hypothetical protein
MTDKDKILNAKFTPIVLTKELRSKPIVQDMLKGVKDGILEEWELGVKHGRISSRFKTKSTEDILTSSSLKDKNYEKLIQAHIQRLLQILSKE